MGRIHHRHLPSSPQPQNLPAEDRSVLNDLNKSETVCGLHGFKNSAWAESITGIFPTNLLAEDGSVLNDPKTAKTVCGLKGLKNTGWAESTTGIFQAAHNPRTCLPRTAACLTTRKELKRFAD